MKLYVIAGETDKEYIIRTLYGYSSNHAEFNYRKLEPKAECLNIDLLTKETADEYGVFFADCEQLCINQKEIV
jgi:hypothetical protein